jgi:hypothetical protein
MGVSTMVDDSTREAFEIALHAALRDQARANATVDFLREKLGMAESAAPIVLGPGDPERAGEARDVGPVSVTDGEFFGMSQPKAAAIFLERAGRTRPQRTEAIIAALRKGGVTFAGKDPVQSFYTILSRNGGFTNVGKSTWGLSSWYPDRAKKPGKANAASETTNDEPAPADQAANVDATAEEGASDDTITHVTF